MEMSPVTTGVQAPVMQNMNSNITTVNNTASPVQSQNGSDEITLSTKQSEPETPTPWYKKTITLILGGIALIGLGCYAYKKRGSKVSDVINPLEKIKEKENSLNEIKENIEKVNQDNENIKKHITEKVIDNPELEAQWNLLQRIEESGNEELQTLKPLLIDSMLAEIDPGMKNQVAVRLTTGLGTQLQDVTANFKEPSKHFGFTLNPVRNLLKKPEDGSGRFSLSYARKILGTPKKMFEVPREKSDAELVETFAPLIKKIREKAESDPGNEIFVSKVSAKDLAANKAKYADPMQQENGTDYQFLQFLPNDLQEIAQKGIKKSLEELESEKNKISTELEELRNKAN